jgi:hypothetical protein
MRIRACLTALALTISASAVASTAMTNSAALAAQRPADETTVSQNTLRDGWDPNEPGLSPATVSGGSFGQLFKTPVDGQVYAQPLVIDNPAAPSTTVIAVTENDSVYSIDGTTGAVKWKDTPTTQNTLGTPWASSVAGCHDLWPQIGITSTPVYDAATGTIYVVAVDTNGNPNTTTPQFVLYALDEQTGSVKWKKAIAGSPANAPSLTFNAASERQRAGLLEMADSHGDPWIYMAFGSICDAGTYRGYVAGVNVGTAHQGAETLWTDETGSTNDEGGIWGSGGGLVSFQPGQIIFTSGNGVSPPSGPGSPTPPELGDAVVRLDVQADGSLKAADFFSPVNAPALAASDRDLGSSSPVALPAGTSSDPNLLVQAGKDGRLFLLNGQNLGGRGTTTDTSLSQSGPYGGQWGHPAAFVGSDGTEYVYYSGTGYNGPGDYLRALNLNASNPAAPVLTEVGNTTVPFGFSSGSPVVTSNGKDPASAVVWEVSTTDQSGANGTLEAFDAVPVSGILQEIWSAPIGTSAKFSVPATDGGQVYVGTRGNGTTTDPGDVYGFGVTTQLPFGNVRPVTFNDAGAGTTSSSATVTLTASQDVTITSASLTSAMSPSPVALGTPAVNGTPVGTGLTGLSLAAGTQQLTVPLTFTPTATGQYTGSLQLSVTDAAGSTVVNIPLSGMGTTPGLTAEPSTLAFGANGTGGNDTNFGPVPVGLSEPIQATITNTTTSPQTITGVTGPAAPFTMTPLASRTLQPGESVVITGTYTPTTVTSSDQGTITVSYTDGTTPATLPINLTGVSKAGQGVASLSATSIAFGHVNIGTTPTKNVSITNTGDLPVTLTGVAASGLPFSIPGGGPQGLTLSPGDDATLPVNYTPVGPGTSTGSVQFIATDSLGQKSTLTIGVSGVAIAPSKVAVPSPGGGWTLNGSAVMKGTTLDLTTAAGNQTGSAVYYQPVASNGLKATFTEQTAGVHAGDGLTFSLLTPGTPAALLGGTGGLLGYGGLPGIAIVVGTRKDAGFPSGNFVGIATGTSAGHLVFAATSSSVPNLRSGTHVIGVSIAGQKVTVTVDAKQYLSATVTALPATVLPAFTAATSNSDDLHAVSKVALTASTGAIPPPGGGWSYNGTAALTGADTQLTPATAAVAGTVIYPRAVSTASVTATFQVQIGGGSGANGMTFAFLSPTTPANSVGLAGSGLGLQKLSGLAVVLSTYPILGVSSRNFVSIVTSSATGLALVGSARVPVQQLNSGTHTVTLSLVQNPTTKKYTLMVAVDGLFVLQYGVNVAATALLAYTAATGHLTDIHTVRNAAIAAAAW